MKYPTATPLPCANVCKWGGKCQFNTLHGTGLHKGEVSWTSCHGSAQKSLGATGSPWSRVASSITGKRSHPLQAHAVWKQDFQTPPEGRFGRMQPSVYMLGNSLVTNPCSVGIFCRQVHAWEQPFWLWGVKNSTNSKMILQEILWGFLWKSICHQSPSLMKLSWIALRPQCCLILTDKVKGIKN